MENLIFSINAIAPMVLLALVGAGLKRKGWADAGFFAVCDKIVFRICLPCTLFLDITEATFADIEVKLMVFCGIFVTTMFLVMLLIAPRFLKNKRDAGTFIQGCCRSNAAIIGITMARNILGAESAVLLATTLPVVILLFNVYSVIILTIMAPGGERTAPGQLLGRIGKDVIKNPLIQAVLLGAAWSLLGLQLPAFLEKGANYLAEMTFPLALMSIGAGFSLKALFSRVDKALIAALMKLIVFPTMALLAARFAGISTMGMGVVFVLFGSPTAVSSYTMAKQMNSNGELAGEIVMVSTLLSIFTLFAGILILRTLQIL